MRRICRLRPSVNVTSYQGLSWWRTKSILAGSVCSDCVRRGMPGRVPPMVPAREVSGGK
jgi:hypothetical protein